MDKVVYYKDDYGENLDIPEESNLSHIVKRDHIESYQKDG
ncbi:MAG: hypothetical protein ACJAZZ_000673 [Dokdonia donghaensis]|jgi:hypothetical protein